MGFVPWTSLLEQQQPHGTAAPRTYRTTTEQTPVQVEDLSSELIRSFHTGESEIIDFSRVNLI